MCESRLSIIRQFATPSTSFQGVRMADARIVQKMETAVCRMPDQSFGRKGDR
jgi:hypothetical protein